MAAADLRELPSVDRLLQTVGDTDLPRPILVGLIRRAVAAERLRRTDGECR